ncbi:hypothetical protein F4779DRAFT_642221 [Xylariaceae sp. FL0662B]|nr:hypothetical protein F4779DRAFT_642221 [Xylariaceae sp. FL0662B]
MPSGPSNRQLSFNEPPHLFDRAQFLAGDEHFDSCKDLFNHVTKKILGESSHSRNDWNKFFHLVTSIGSSAALDYVLLRGVVCQIPEEYDDGYELLASLLWHEANRHHDRSRQSLLTRNHIENALSYSYRQMTFYPLPGVTVEETYNRFNHFAIHLYSRSTIRDPVFFVTTMIDALETVWDDANSIYMPLIAATKWIRNHGDSLFTKVRRDPESRYPMKAGAIWQETCSERSPRVSPDDLTVERWIFWQQRLANDMPNVFQRDLALINLTKRAAETMWVLSQRRERQERRRR